LLVVGGPFEGAGDIAASKVAAWDGTRWQSLGSEMAPVYGSVQALTVYNGELIAGGSFTSLGGVSVEDVARWNGSSWLALGEGMSGHNGEDGELPFVDALTVYNGELIAGGGFTSAGGVSADNIARWNGSAWQTLGELGNPGLYDADYSPVYALTVHNGVLSEQLVAGGDFITAGNEISAFWARFGRICAPGDLDEDGAVGWLDFQSLLLAWGPCAAPCPPRCAADLDGDCTVGILDFLTLLLNWG
jgi:hypothetical protein